VVKAGDVVKVRVVDVDLKRKRIALTMRKHDDGEAGRPEQRTNGTPPPARAKPPGRSGSARRSEKAPQGAFGAALAEALKRR
jgi:protein Tex